MLKPNIRIIVSAASLSLVMFVSSCSSYRDDEHSKYNQDVITSILMGRDENYKPNKIVYIEDPKKSPSHAVSNGYRLNSIQSKLDEVFFPYVLRNGFTVACAEDKEKGSAVIVLSHNGIYQTYGTYPLGGFVTILCKSGASK